MPEAEWFKIALQLGSFGLIAYAVIVHIREGPARRASDETIAREHRATTERVAEDWKAAVISVATESKAASDRLAAECRAERMELVRQHAADMRAVLDSIAQDRQWDRDARHKQGCAFQDCVVELFNKMAAVIGDDPAGHPSGVAG